jgi:lysophospholipase L1-like esterase
LIVFKVFILFILALPSFGKEIFLFGDSMAEAVAKPLEKKFSGTLHSFSYKFKRGTRVDYWIFNPELYLELGEKKPDIVLISLGTNDLVAKKSNEQIINSLNILIEDLALLGIPRENIVLVATPIQNDNNLNSDMKIAFEPYLIPSKDLLLELKADNIHPTITSNQIWSGFIFDALKVYFDL